MLRHLTFYTLNRVYLVCAILFATLYPLVDFSALLYRHQEIARPVQIIIVNWQAPVARAVQAAQQHNKWFWLELVFWAGVIVLAVRFIMQLLSLYKLHKQSKPIELHQYLVRVIQGDINPFSFWKSIYINPDNHEPAELKAILAHEQVHVNEWHTLDILLGELSSIFYWFNPGVWLMKRAIRENIEFITDQKILQGGSDPKAYQYSLLNVSFSGGHSAIVNHFNTSTIKKRIIMMNSKRSSTINLTRYAVLVPAVILLVLVFSVSKAELGKQVAKGNAAIAKAFNVTINTIIPENVTSATTVAKRKLMVLPNAVSAFLTEAPLHIVIDTPKVGKIIGDNGNVITVVGYGKQKNDTIFVSKDEKTQSLFNSMRGFTVTSDGKTMINGKEVRAIRLNGTTYYGPLNNLRADSISKIQIISDYKTPASNNSKEVIVRGRPMGASTMRLNGDTQGQPLMVVDGKPIENVSAISQDNIQAVAVLKGATAMTYYGDKAKDGAIVITTKADPLYMVNGNLVNKAILNLPIDQVQKIRVYNDFNGMTYSSDQIKNGVVDVTTTKDGNAAKTVEGFRITNEPRVLNFNTKNLFSGKLLLLDGKETTESELNKIPAEKIKLIKQLTEKEKAQYGDKAKNGGFSITTIK